MLRSIGMEPDELNGREKWLLLTRMIPLVENNFNLCELGPRSTGKSHLYKEISPNSILVSGGQTTVANLFYNIGRKTVGLVGLWDCVAFDEVAGIRFKDKDGIQNHVVQTEDQLRKMTDMLVKNDVRIIRESMDVIPSMKNPETKKSRQQVMATRISYLEKLEPFVSSSNKALLQQAKKLLK